MSAARILLVDDHDMVADALSRILEGVPEVGGVEIATSVPAAWKVFTAKPPDLALIDVQLPGQSGFDLADRIQGRFPQSRFLFMSGQASDLDLHRALTLGAGGFILKAGSTAFLRAAVAQALRGEMVFSPEIEPRIEQDPAGGRVRLRNAEAVTPLCEGHLEVLRLLATGMSVRQIAGQLNLSVKAIDSRKYRLMKQLDLHDKAELTRFAIRHGLIEA